MASDQVSTMLNVLVQHHSVYNDQQLIMQLLRTSEAARAVVLAQCTGLVPVTAKRNSPPHFTRMQRQVKQFIRWAAKFGTIMRSLDIQLPLNDYQALAAALKRAAAAAVGGKLQLEQFKSAMVPESMLRTLGKICTLRSLNLGISCPAESYEQRQYEALAALTSLEELKLHSQAAAQLLPGVSALSRLTSLELANFSNSTGSAGCGPTKHLNDPLRAIERYLPHQLRRLTLDIRGEAKRASSPLQLQHLTALTALNINGDGQYPSLPASLRSLTLAHFETDSVQPLLSLARLRTLCIKQCCCTADQLQQLGRSLRRLHAVELNYVPIWDHDFYNDAAAGFAAVPLTNLDLIVWRAPLYPNTLRSMQELTRLTRLSMQTEGAKWVKVPITAEAFGSVLEQLSRLRQLQLVGLQFASRGGLDSDSELQDSGTEDSADYEDSEYDSEDDSEMCMLAAAAFGMLPDYLAARRQVGYDSSGDESAEEEEFPAGVLGETGGWSWNQGEIGYEPESEDSYLCDGDCDCDVCEAVAAAEAGKDFDNSSESGSVDGGQHNKFSVGLLPLMQSIAGLERLRGLTLGRMPLCSTVRALASATQLTCLQLYKVGMGAQDAAVMVERLWPLQFVTSWADERASAGVMRRFTGVDPEAASNAAAVVQLVGTSDGDGESKTAEHLMQEHAGLRVRLPLTVQDYA